MPDHTVGKTQGLGGLQRGSGHRITSVNVDKLSVSFDSELGDAVRRAAAEAGKPLSAWLAEAAASKLGTEALAPFLDSAALCVRSIANGDGVK
jgi:hypothetical protein